MMNLTHYIKCDLLSIYQFSDVYSPERDLSFDEATCAWKGRLRFRVYNPAKPTRFGIKLYQVCEATSGYCLGFDVYTSETACTDYAELVGCIDATLTTKTVLGLLVRCGLIEKGHNVYMDNFYTSPELLLELESQNTYACGTLRVNRKGVPNEIKRKTKLGPTECIFRRNGNMLAVKNRDKRDVHMLSTIHEAKVAVLNKVDRRTDSLVSKPVCITDYVKFMGGVDLSDQFNSYNSCLQKTTKWYKKLFFHLFNVCLINAYLLHKKFAPNEKKLDHQQFLIALVSEVPNISSKGRKHVDVKPSRLIETLC